MKVRAEATPLAGPLEGRSGHSSPWVVIHPLRCGTATFPRGLFEQEKPGLRGTLAARGVGVSREDYPRLPVPVFLIEHPAAGLVLVDTGLHPSIANDPRDNMGRILARYHELERGTDAASQIRERGFNPADVKTVVMTHLHADHASAMSEFSQATFVLSSAEWTEATQHASLLKGYRPAHYDHAFEFATVDFDAEFISSYGSFGRTFDLFGDGTIRLAFTPGHTPGHCSVICRLPRRDFVIIGDAAYNWRQLEGGPEPFQVDDRHSWRRSLREVQAFHKAYPYALLVPGHDRDFWPKLDARYEE